MKYSNYANPFCICSKCYPVLLGGVTTEVNSTVVLYSSYYHLGLQIYGGKYTWEQWINKQTSVQK